MLAYLLLLCLAQRHASQADLSPADVTTEYPIRWTWLAPATSAQTCRLALDWNAAHLFQKNVFYDALCSSEIPSTIHFLTTAQAKSSQEASDTNTTFDCPILHIRS